jgi:NAD(P)-dependent dehydrogenase (short-subunit alcohol dehydrogenase family)
MRSPPPEEYDAVARQAGRIDASFNGIGIPQQGVQGVPLGDLSPEGFGLPIRTYTTAQFLTSRAMARRMAEHGSGVILTITSTAARLAVPGVGGMGAAWAAVETLSRGLAAELGPQGIRVICLRAHGMPETSTIQEVLGLHAESIGLTREQVQAIWEDQTLLRRLPTLAEVADAAAYLASDRASAMTATVSNLTVGAIAE